MEALEGQYTNIDKMEKESSMQKIVVLCPKDQIQNKQGTSKQCRGYKTKYEEETKHVIEESHLKGEPVVEQIEKR